MSDTDKIYKIEGLGLGGWRLGVPVRIYHMTKVAEKTSTLGEYTVFSFHTCTWH